MNTLRYCVALSATTLVLAGCGADAEPKFEAGPSPTAATSASPTPDEPEPWKEKTPEGAVAFAEHWTSTFSDAFQTGDTSKLESVSSSTCASCQDFVDLIREVYDGGGSISGASWKLRDPSWSAPSGKDGPIIVAGEMRIPKQVIDRAGEQPSSARATVAQYLFTVEWQAGAWTTTRLVRQI